MEQYLVIIEKGDQNYSAYSPDVLGCVTTGETVEETLQRMKEALELHVEGMIEDGDELPRAKGLKFYLAQQEPVAEPGDLITHIQIALPTAA